VAARSVEGIERWKHGELMEGWDAKQLRS
jgi:hypothetical protein